MTTKYDDYLTEMLDHVESMLTSKGDEYATDTDHFHNFVVAADLMSTTQQAALAGMMSKHTVSVYDMAQDPIIIHSKEKWTEKIGDHIAYLCLLWQMVCETYDRVEALSN